MPGLYPEDQILTLFGKEVRWPGLDPSTGKFTNGSFTDPLVEPSFIPAETINLILDSLQNLITDLGLTPDSHDPAQLSRAVKDYNFPVGRMLEFYPDEPTPVKIGWPGAWDTWSDRSIMYGVSASPPPSFVDYYTLAGNSIPAGAAPVVCYHKQGDDFRLYKFIPQTAAYTVPEELDPVKWAYLVPDEIAGRQRCGNLLTDADFVEVVSEMGYEITTGLHAGKYVTEVIVPGGKFPSIEGGNRPTFISGGVQGDRIRNIIGDVFAIGWSASVGASGAFFSKGGLGGSYQASVSTSNRDGIGFDPSRVSPTGPDNAGTNLSKRLWRRVS
ncbi:MAG: hypothetical protein LBK05_10320 [Treponema sp.]|jgi:hypothetical protein|nr:hypothetical protein [Treponema sp.]